MSKSTINGRKYKENYTDNSKDSRVVTPKTDEQWFEWMNERKGDFPKPSYEGIIWDLEISLIQDLENLESLEYFKEEIPVKIKDIRGWDNIWTDHDEIDMLKDRIGKKKYQLELIKSLVSVL
jgi:hypothetical protein